jgi:hypothetical protein
MRVPSTEEYQGKDFYGDLPKFPSPQTPQAINRWEEEQQAEDFKMQNAQRMCLRLDKAGANTRMKLCDGKGLISHIVIQQ